jgi:hypothetical protein
MERSGVADYRLCFHSYKPLTLFEYFSTVASRRECTFVYCIVGLRAHKTLKLKQTQQCKVSQQSSVKKHNIWMCLF